MNNSEIKKILQAYRPEIDQLEDEKIKKALEAAANNTEIKAFLDNELEFDSAISQKLKSIQPPADLRNKILSIVETTENDLSKPNLLSGKSVTTNNIVWWKQAMPLSIAACFMIILALGVVFINQTKINKQHDELNLLIQAVAENAKNSPKLEYKNNQLVELTRFLNDSNSPSPNKLPKSIEDLKSIGCVTMDIKGHPMSMICFKGDRLYHLYVTEQNKLPDLNNNKPTINNWGEITTAAWTINNQLYILSAEGDSNVYNDIL